MKRTVALALEKALSDVRPALCRMLDRLRSNRSGWVTWWLEGGPWPGIRIPLSGGRLVFDCREPYPYFTFGGSRHYLWWFWWDGREFAQYLASRFGPRQALEFIYCLRAVAAVAEEVEDLQAEKKLKAACRKASEAVKKLTDDQVLAALEAEAALGLLGGEG